jgi:hypothetical protein
LKKQREARAGARAHIDKGRDEVSENGKVFVFAGLDQIVGRVEEGDQQTLPADKEDRRRG